MTGEPKKRSEHEREPEPALKFRRSSAFMTNDIRKCSSQPFQRVNTYDERLPGLVFDIPVTLGRAESGRAEKQCV
jgi:hypothetical protein